MPTVTRMLAGMERDGLVKRERDAADRRVISLLAAAATAHRIEVSVIKTGHGMYVAGTNRVSNHYFGRAVDIVAVDDVEVGPTNQAAIAELKVTG